MLGIFKEIISITGYMLEAVGVVIIVIGAIRATIRAARELGSADRKKSLP